MASRNKGTIPWKIWVPADLALRIELRYCDPIQGRPNYGVRSHLIVALLREFEQATLQARIADNPGAVRALVARLIDHDKTKAKEPI